MSVEGNERQSQEEEVFSLNAVETTGRKQEEKKQDVTQILV